MKLQNLSVRAFLRKIVAGTLLTAALLLLIFFLLTKDVRVVICGIILTAAFFIWGMVFLHYFQKKLSLFTDGLCQTLDHMMDSTDRPQVDYEAETLLSRISHRLERLYNVMQKTRHTAEVEGQQTENKKRRKNGRQTCKLAKLAASPHPHTCAYIIMQQNNMFQNSTLFLYCDL